VGVEDDFGIGAIACAVECQFSPLGGIDIGRYPDEYSGDPGRTEQAFAAGTYWEFCGAGGSAHRFGKCKRFEWVVRV
jgi:hypothetical protein